MNQSHWTLDIEIYEEFVDHVWAQAKYLVHGHDDVLWTNDLDEAISFLKSSAQAVS
jgi:hypothetical protein